MFRSEGAITGHLKSPAHGRAGINCPECHDEFKSVAALVGHLEASGTACFAKFSDTYREAIEVASGGFLMVKKELNSNEEEVPVIDVGEPTWDGGRKRLK